MPGPVTRPDIPVAQEHRPGMGQKMENNPMHPKGRTGEDGSKGHTGPPRSTAAPRCMSVKPCAVMSLPCGDR